MLTFPEFQNVFIPPENEIEDNTIPNLERRTASAGIGMNLQDQMKTLKNVSITSLNIINSKLLLMSLKGFSRSEQSEQFMLEDFIKYDCKTMYKSVPIMDSDSNEESDTD